MFKFDKNSFSRFGALILIVVVFGLGFFAGQNNLPIIPAPDNVDSSLFWDAYNKLQSNFVDPSKIDNQKIIYGAISGMTKSLDDPYTEFFDPAEAKAFQQELSGSFEGVGMEVGLKKGQLIVIAPLKDTPAEKAGLKSGDQIIKIDSKSTYDLTIGEAVNLIRGKRGTAVTLTVFRDGWDNAKDVEIVRGTIKIDSVTWELLASTGEADGKDNDIAYIHIFQFDQPLSDDFKKIANEILKSSAKKIILDLRDNPGGYLETSQYVAGWFLQSGQIVTIEDFGKNKEQHLYKAEGNGVFSNYPIVVLINKGSASASEILAGALRDNRSVQLIGEKSFGKGSVQEVISLSDNQSFLKITIAKWLTPKGDSISEVGLNPDVKVDLTEGDVNSNKDPQLDKALEIVKDLK